MNKHTTTQNIRRSLKLSVLALVAGSALWLSGCREKPENYQRPLVYDVDYRGHHYIVFRVDENFGQTFVHDPDCKCGKK